jgi:uncharacterized protein (TIGR02466 family)
MFTASLSMRACFRPAAAAVLLSAACVAGVAHAAITTVATLASFTSATTAAGTDNFSNLTINSNLGLTTVNRTAGAYAYNMVTQTDFYVVPVAGAIAVSTSNFADTLTFGGFASSVRAFGGNFYGTNILGEVTAGGLTLLATDINGATLSAPATGGSASGFLGFISDVPLRSVVLSMTTPNTNVFASVDNVVMAARRNMMAPPATIISHVLASGTAADEVIGLFATPFMRAKSVLDAALVAGLVEHFVALAQRDNNSSAQLSHTEMLRPADSPLFVKVAALITPKLADFGALMFGEHLGWSVKEMWVNVLDTGGRQAMHNHANSFISGVVYLTDTHPESCTVFMKSPGGTDFIFRNDHAHTTPGPYSADKWVSPQPTPGDMVLFPSYLMHAVPPNPGARRISLAFNAIPTRLDSWGYAVSFSG